MSKTVSAKIGSNILEVVQGDITLQNTEAVVNAANNQLAPGGGVAGAIHRAAGPELYEECKKIAPCETGEAKITKAYRLLNKYVIHTVGPVYHNDLEDAALLRDCYINSLRLAEDNSISSVAFPAISTGIFGYPVEEASVIALEAIREFLLKAEKITLVRMVLYDAVSFAAHKKALEKIIKVP